MGDRMFASEGDSVDVGRRGPARSTDRHDGGDSYGRPSEIAAVGVARRLQGRLDHHLWLLGRLPSEPLYPDPPGLPELLETVRRIRRDSESLLLLNGADPGVRTGGPRRLSDILDDAASAAEETRRVDVRSAPAATVTPAASVEFEHVLAEVVDHVTAVYPDARIDVTSYVDARAGITVDVFVDGAERHDPDGLGGQRAVAAARELARCSRSGIELHCARGGAPPTGSGLVASVSCPSAAVTVEGPAWSRLAVGGDSVGGDPFQADPRGGDPVGVAPNGSGDGFGHYGNGSGSLAATPPPREPSVPAYASSASSQADELFGPLLDLSPEPAGDQGGTPIFEAIASAWFQEDDPSPNDAAPNDAAPDRRRSDPLDWESPSDPEWRGAAARAAQPDPAPSTSAGLPRRRPGDRLVPPPRTQSTPDSGPAERAPDRVRDRLSTYQRGLRQGRHRAPGPDEPDDADIW